MAITTVRPPGTILLTYDDYMSEETVYERNDIVDGVREYMAAPTWQHQRIISNFIGPLASFEANFEIGYALTAPFDILLHRHPLRTRQPDVFFITKEQLERGGGIPDHGPIEIGPELVIEIISSSDRTARFQKRIEDFCRLGVMEMWVVRPNTMEVEVLALSSHNARTVATYSKGETVQSITFLDLRVPVADIFEP